MKLSEISRRSFVKAAAAAGAAAASPLKAFAAGEGSTQKNAALKDDTQIITTTCRACIHNCGVRAHVRNGRVVKIEGDPNYPMANAAKTNGNASAGMKRSISSRTR